MMFTILAITLVLLILAAWFVSRLRISRQIDSLKNSRNIDSLSDIARQSWNSRRGRLAVGALESLGYRCVYHPAEGHDEVVGFSFYCNYSDTVPDCQANCVEGDKCRKEPDTKVWIEDKPKIVEIIKREAN